MELSSKCVLLYIFISEVQFTTEGKEVTRKEIRPFMKVGFQPISITREYDRSTSSVTYTAKIKGPDDAVRRFNGTLKRVYGDKSEAILKARLRVSISETPIPNHPVIVLSSHSSSTTFILGIDTVTTRIRQTYFSGTDCSYGISSTSSGNIIGYNSRASCFRKSSSVYSDFEATLKWTAKGLDVKEDESVSKGYYNSSSSVNGKNASSFFNLAKMKTDDINLDTLKFELMTEPETQEIVAFTIWSFNIV